MSPVNIQEKVQWAMGDTSLRATCSKLVMAKASLAPGTAEETVKHADLPSPRDSE